jgi:hypothetical protein
MPVCFPALLRLGGEERCTDYQREFDRLYRTATILDVLGREVVFAEGDCEHVCKSGKPRVWNQARAERIPWIATALQTPDSIRPSHQMPGRQVYMVEGNLPAPMGNEWHRFLVYVEPQSERRPKRVYFTTAYPPDTLQYWNAAGHQAPRIYPPKRR